MKQAIAFPYTQAALRGTNASLLHLFRMKATSGLLRNFALRNDDSARSEAAGGRSHGGGIKAPSKPFSKLLQNSRVLLQAFPNKSLAVLWDFNGLQVFQTPFDAFQIFRLRPPAFGRILPGFTMQFSRQRFHRGAATQIERILIALLARSGGRGDLPAHRARRAERRSRIRRRLRSGPAR